MYLHGWAEVEDYLGTDQLMITDQLIAINLVNFNLQRPQFSLIISTNWTFGLLDYWIIELLYYYHFSSKLQIQGSRDGHAIVKILPGTVPRTRNSNKHQGKPTPKETQTTGDPRPSDRQKLGHSGSSRAEKRPTEIRGQRCQCHRGRYCSALR